MNELVKQIINHGSFELGRDYGFVDNGIKPKPTIPSFISNPKSLANYENDALYFTEKALKKWFEIKLQDEAWIKNRYARQYTCSMIVEEIFGRPYDQIIDGSYTSYYSRVFAHYCSKVGKSYWNRKKQKSYRYNCYCFSVDRIRRVKPFSIRLRVEQMMEQGKIPVYQNCKEYTILTAGKARSNKTQKRMNERAKRAKKAYEQRKRNTKTN